MLRSSFFASRKRKKPKDKAQLSSSDDDLDGPLVPDDGGMVTPVWSPDRQTEGEEEEEQRRSRLSSEDQLDGPDKQPMSPEVHTPSPPRSPTLSERMSMTHQSTLSDPPGNYDDTVSDLGTMNSTSSQASMPRVRRYRGLHMGPEGVVGGTDVCSITSDYSTTSSMTFLTGGDLSALSPEVQSVSESRGDDADDERSELISEGRPAETDSESDLSVFTVGRDSVVLRPLQSHRLIEGDTLSRKKAQKTTSESSLDGRSDKDSNRLSRAMGSTKGRSSGSLSSSSRSELDKTEPAWRLKITDRLKVRLRMSVDDMFGVGSQRTPEGRTKKKNIRRRHTMGGQRDFAELSVLDWSQPVSIGPRSELSAVDRLKPKCSSQDFSIGDWLARERHRTSNPEVSLETGDQQGECGASASCDPAPRPEAVNGEVPPSKNLSLSATAHPHKLTSSQVVHSRFYQYL